MESLLTSIFLEELVFEGANGSYVDTVFEKVTERGFALDSCVKKSVWNTIRAFPHVLFLTCSGDTQDGGHAIEEKDIPLDWKEISERKSQCIFNHLKLVAKKTLAHKVLDVWNRPEILQSNIRMNILYAIAGRRYKGIPQIELCQLFQQDTKWLFQHLKAFYKYNMIVRRYASLPQSGNQTKSSNTTYVIWLERFFNKNFFSKEMLQALELQQQLPIGSQILDFLGSIPNNIALESDIRSFFLKMSYNHEVSNPSCNSRLLHRQYTKLRRDLLESKQIIAVQAFCKEKEGYEDCLALSSVYDKLCFSQQKFIHSDGSPTNNFSSSTPTNVLHEKLGEKTNNSICTITTDVLPSLSCVSALMSACNETSCTTDKVKTTELSQEPLEEDDYNSWFSSCLVYELPVYEQVLCLLKSSPVKGVLTTDIADVVGVIPKRLMRLLSNLENSGLILRHGERLGKHFIYRFFLKCCSEDLKSYSENFSHILKNATSATFNVLDSPKPDNSVLNKVETVPRTSPNQTSLHQKLYTPKTLTVQFQKRLQCVKETVQNLKVCTVPNFIRVLAVKEGNNGPDRKTVIRLLNHAMFEDKNIQQTQLPMNSSDLIKIYYYKTLIQKEQAEQQILHVMTEKRLETSKNALRKIALTKSSIECSETSSQVDTDVNASTANQHNKKMKSSRPLLPMIHVSPHNTKTTKFSQAVLGNYGFIFSLMIRLKIFHSHLITMISDKKCSNGNDSFQKKPKLCRLFHYTTLQILKKMTIETFFRTIGCGYVHPYLDDIFQNKLDITVHHCIEHLPPAVYKILLSSSYRGWRPAQKFQNSSSGAVISADRLLQKLVTLKCVNLIVNDIPAHHDTEHHGVQDTNSKKILWQINPVVSMEPFVSKERGWRTKAPNDVSVFHLIHIEKFEAFWKHFKSHVDQWLQFLQNPAYCTTNSLCDSLHTPMNDVFHLSGRTSLAKTSTSQASSELLTSSAIQMPASILPDNMPLSVAFTKRNWTAKLLLSPSTRTELEKFALSLLEEVNTHVNDELSNGAMSASSLCCYSLKPNHNLLSIQTPSIRKVASKLNLSPDVVIRYLSRFFNPKRDVEFTKLPFSIYTGREPRYSCDSCTNVYFQKRSLVQHCLLTHHKTLEDADCFIEKRSNIWKPTSTVTTSTVLGEPLLACDPLSTIIKQESNSSDKTALEWMETQKLVKNLRRDHVILFFCYVIIADQLYHSCSNARTRTHTNEVSSWVSIPQEIPTMDHVVWELTAELFISSSPFYLQAKRCRRVFMLLLKKYPALFTRVLKDYNQNWNDLFFNASGQKILPVFSSTTALIERSSGNVRKEVNFWNQSQSLIYCENIMRMILICPLLCYRPSWAIDICNSISVEEMVAMTHTWSKHNWIVKTKSTLDRWTNVQRLMDFQCRRKYYISHAVQQLLFEKKKDYMLAYATLNALKDVNEALSGIVVDPCQSSMLYCLLEGVAEEFIQLQVNWESEPELYDWDDQTTDDKLLQLLTNSTLLGKDDVSTENMTGPDAETELIRLLLTENQEASTASEFHDIEKINTHVELDNHLTENGDESDFSENELSGLDVKQRVVARAVEGGLEKHITQLTGNVRSIFDEKITYNVTCLSSRFNKKHMDTLETSSVENRSEFCQNKLPPKKRQLKLFLPYSEFFHQLGCFHETDYPEPLLFSNLNLAYGMHHWREITNESFSCTSLDFLCSASVQIVPWYDSDIDLKWEWGNESTANTKESVNFFQKTKKLTPNHTQLEQFIHHFFIQKNSFLPTINQQKEKLLHLFTKYLLTETLSKMRHNTTQPSVVYQLCFFIKKNFPNYPNVSLHFLAETTAYTSIFYYLQELCLESHKTLEEYFNITEKCKETLPPQEMASEYVVPLLIVILQYVDDSKEAGVTENDIISFVSTCDHQHPLSTYQRNFIRPTPQFVTYLIHGLELLRWITRFPHDKNYIFLTTKNIKHSYILKKRVCGVQILKYHSDQHTLSRCTYPIPSLPFGGLDDIISHVIPQNMWQLWGPLSQCHWHTLVTCALEGGLQNLLLVLSEHQLEVLLCRTLFMSLMISTTKTHLFHPLPTNMTPFGSWIQLDGYLNATFIAFLVCHIFFLLKSTPGALQEEIISKTPLLAKCETIYLLDNLCMEQFIYTTQKNSKINCLQYFNAPLSSSWLL